MSSIPILKVKDVSKAFGSTQALDNVQLDLYPGEIHSLLGENGAGKSTLIKCISGAYTMDTGTIHLADKPISPKSPRDAENLGISTVYQEINLLPNLSVLENITIGRTKKSFLGHIDWKDARKRASAALDRLGVTLDLDAPISTLPVALQQMTAIARALDVNAQVLILDEPTSSLDENEVERLFVSMRKLKEQGIAMIFITHFLDQVFEMSDRVSILRNGKYIATHGIEKLTRENLLQDMLGKAFDDLQNKHQTPNTSSESTTSAHLKVSNLEAPGKLKSLSFDLAKGEVLGLAGLLGSGRTESARLLFGVDKASSGTIELGNDTIPQGNPKNSIQAGILLASEDRKTEGIFPNLSVRENLTIALQGRRGLLKQISTQEATDLTQYYIDAFGIKTSGPEAKISDLSGGNQQKVLLARWLAAKPRVLLLDEPTRGIDIGARAEIEKLIEELSADGLSIILISSELDEEVRCCHRVLVLRDRECIGELSREDLSEESIISLIAQK